eukprot:augustus_masked-scaffold_66-processed-gene-0.99-mRNA-1 protein AED:1.00 eAED:1.00 QI:0/0/0/0/1/1/3/0/417
MRSKNEARLKEREERRRKLEEEEEERRRREQEEEDFEQEQLYGSLNLSTDDEAEDVAEHSASEDVSQVADQGAAKETNCVATGATGRDDPEPDTVADRMVASETEKAEKKVATISDGAEAEIMAQTQPTMTAKEVEPVLPTLVREDEAASNHEALIAERSTNLHQIISKGRNENDEAKAVNLTSPSSAKKKAAKKTPRKKRMIRSQCEFYTKTPQIRISKRVANILAATPNFRESQEMSVAQLLANRKKTPLQVLKTSTPTCFSHSSEGLITTAVQFMAERGMAVIKGNLPKPILSANSDPDWPMRITPFKCVTKAEPAAGLSIRAPQRKMRPLANTRTDAENSLQKRINALTRANERIKTQSLAAKLVLRDCNRAIMRKAVDKERKKNTAEFKRVLKELKETKKLHRAEVEKLREL